MEKNSTIYNLTDLLRSERLMNSTKNNGSAEQPPQARINNILNYSKALKVVKSKRIGYLEMVLN